MIRHFHRAIFAAVITLICQAGVAAEATAAKLTLAIEPQPLRLALAAFAEQSGIQILQREEDSSADGFTAPRVVGELSVREALDRLLANSGLTYEFLNERTVRISARGAAREAEADLKREGRSLIQVAQAEQPESRAEGQRSIASETGVAAKEVQLEEVVVTAQKRGERLKDVPISITVLRGDELDRSTAKGISEELNRVPGVATTQGHIGSNTLVAVRGVAANSTLFAGSSPIAYYLDSVPFGLIVTALAPDANAYDMDRVEVLRGPQGTLYGASAQNGVVRVLTNDANLHDFQLKARGSTSSTDGGGENYRADAAINVPIVAGKLAVRAVAGYEDSSGWIDKPNEKDANDGRRRNLRLKVNAQPTEKLSIGLSSWFSRGDYGAPSMSDDNGQRTTSLLSESTADDYDVYGLKIGYDFSSFAATNTAGYIDYANDSQFDYFYVVADTLLNTRLASRVFSDELIVHSTRPGNWRWSFGAMYRDALEQDQQLRRQYTVGPSVTRYTSESITAFGELTRVFHDGRFELTGGLRYFEDDVTFQQVSLPFGFPAGQTQFARLSDTFDAVSPRVVLNWHPTQNLTLYSSYSQGFRSGIPLFNAAAPDFPPVEPDKLKNYEIGSKGSLWGGRLSFDAAVFYMDWQDVQQTMTVNIAPPNQTPQFFGTILNGSSASGPGFEFAILSAPVQGLRLGVSFGWNDLQMDEDLISRNVLLFPKGARLNLSPKYTAGASADYSFPLGASGLMGRANVSANHISQQTTRTVYPTVLSTGVGDPMTLSRASFAVESGGHWTATIFADNLNNENGASLVQPFGFTDWATRPRPRTIGAQLEFRF